MSVKSGVKTSELYVIIGGIAGTGLLAWLGAERAPEIAGKIEAIAIIVSGVLAGVYALTRAMVKSSNGD